MTATPKSAPVTIDVTVSADPLLDFDFNQSRILFTGPGAEALIQVYGDFADESGVLLPLSFVNVQIADPTVATLSANGVLTSVGDGYTILSASRGLLATATVVGVGTPTDGDQLIADMYNILPYPASVTLLPNGGTKDIVTQLGTLPTDLLPPTDGLTYVSMNSGVATVNANGIITGVGAGSTEIIVLWTYGEGIVDVQVQPAIVANTATIGTTGGIIQNPDGITVGFGQGQLASDTSVTVTTIPEAQLPLPMVGGTTGAFPFVNAFELDTSGSALTGAVQMAAPVNGLANPGDTVYFFQLTELPPVRMGHCSRIGRSSTAARSTPTAWRKPPRRRIPGSDFRAPRTGPRS